MYEDGIDILLDSYHGVYIPQLFAQQCLGEEGGWSNISPNDLEILCEGPDHEWYWEAWQSVLSDAEYADEHGTYILHHDGDLFACCPQKMTLQEQHDLFSVDDYDDFTLPVGCNAYTVASHFVPALYYGIDDGITDEDESALQAFVKTHGEDIVDHIEYGIDQCEITGLQADCSLIVLKEVAA